MLGSIIDSPFLIIETSVAKKFAISKTKYGRIR